ncbi:MAG: PIN domain-containing protein [Treponema sp.]|nr:PIN domain-containing protein [Treponema sp.]
MEGEAVLAIISRCRQNLDEIVGSPALDLEINQIGDVEKKEKVKYLYEQAITTKMGYTENILKQTRELSEQTSIRTLDGFHLAFAENSGVDFLLTTDIKFERVCSKLKLNTHVMNPLKYLTEVMLNEYGT